MEGNQTLLDPPPDTQATSDRTRSVEKKTHAFTFDKSYWSAGDRSESRYCSQETLYNDLGTELLDHGFAGFNACILACKSHPEAGRLILNCLARRTNWYALLTPLPLLSPALLC